MMNEHEHPAVTFYGSADYQTAANAWYENAMLSAKQANALYEELYNLRKHWIVRWIERRDKKRREKR